VWPFDRRPEDIRGQKLTTLNVRFGSKAAIRWPYCFAQTNVTYVKQIAATTMRTRRWPAKIALQYVPITIPVANNPALKKAACHHFNENVLN
jgi:hypothetical protein